MYQHGYPRHGYTEWVAEIIHHSVVLFATNHAHITLSHMCRAKQGSSFAYPTSNVVTSLKSKTFFPPTQSPHPPLVQWHSYTFHSKNSRCLTKDLILIIQLYYDDDTGHIAALVLHHLITQVKWSLDRKSEFFLTTKLGRKHKK